MYCVNEVRVFFLFEKVKRKKGEKKKRKKKGRTKKERREEEEKEERENEERKKEEREKKDAQMKGVGGFNFLVLNGSRGDPSGRREIILLV